MLCLGYFSSVSCSEDCNRCCFAFGHGIKSVLYDGLCPICVTEIQFFQFLQRNRPVKVDFVDISLPVYSGEKYKDVSYEMAMEEMHVIDEKDKVNLRYEDYNVLFIVGYQLLQSCTE
ncbi:uncharacterized protein At5g50100, chloroplastic-like isoform X3 [Cyclopterus lumpus]|uniref:uncharacterized protein At5g50100, chloroplastic-like isoform X3 n=1 Tax=Cyclopterus lumpus TaxID=8103 RepID=UPI001485C684|nr:uncharacterized protein At5g50100, chloroplastic-like isoform X3 [Cyclopterus lumpus]